MPDGLYEHDALAWSEQQADLLRRLAAGERLNEAPDWDNVIEEIRDVGNSELHGCQSLLTRALEHLMKLHLEPESPAVPHWRGEVAGFLAGARRYFAPSMRQRLDLPSLYKDARFQAVVGAADEAQAATLPQTCPYALDDLLTPDINPATLAACLATP